jgi:iron complex outermembrane receptor protein
VEVEGQLNPLAGISVNFGLTYADSRFSTVGLSCPLQFQATATRPAIAPCVGAAGGSAGLQNVEDGRLPYAPKWRILVMPRVEHELTASGLLGFVQASFSYQSWQTFSLEQDPLLVQKGYALVDASVGVRSKDKGYSLTLFVRNLFDQNYYSSMAHTSLLATATNASDLTAYVNKDSNRYFGATFGYAF